MNIDVDVLKKMLKETYLEVGKMDLETKSIKDTQSLTASKFRQVMLQKIDSINNEPTN